MAIRNDLWWDKTWNPITGCSPVSEGCEHCWAKRLANRLRGRYGYPQEEPFRVTFHPDKRNDPLRWKKPCRIFVCIMGDFFHHNVPLDWRNEVYRIIEKCPQHIFMFLTKRPQNVTPFWIESPNVWLGVSCENQARADERIPILLQIPAAVRFVSLEPMLGPVDLRFCDEFPDADGCYEDARHGIDWVILGGLSLPGNKIQPPRRAWVDSIVQQCDLAGVPLFIKSNAQYPIERRSFPQEDLHPRKSPVAL